MGQRPGPVLPLSAGSVTGLKMLQLESLGARLDISAVYQALD